MSLTSKDYPENRPKAHKVELPTPQEAPLMRSYESVVDNALSQLAKSLSQVALAQEQRPALDGTSMKAMAQLGLIETE